MTLSLIENQALLNMTSGATNPVSNKQNALAIRLYGDDAKRVILAKRAEYRKWILLTQQNWRMRVSRRAQRGNHHDSWAIREDYVRQGNGYQDFYALGHSLILQAESNGAKSRIPGAERRYIR